jgi:hypothetical protein
MTWNTIKKGDRKNTLTVTGNLNFHQVGKEDAVSFLKYAFPIKFHGAEIIPTNEAEIKSIIHYLKSKNSLGYYEIMGKILKAC